MKTIMRALTLFSILACVTWFVAERVADNEHVGVPDYYRNLDTNLPFNDLARKSLALKISNAEYDAIRWQYFEDRVAPNISPLRVAAAWEDFKQQTERPDFPGRQKTVNDYVETYRWVFVAFALFLLFRLCSWTWRGVLNPARKVVMENGIYGLFRIVAFGKKESLPK